MNLDHTLSHSLLEQLTLHLMLQYLIMMYTAGEVYILILLLMHHHYLILLWLEILINQVWL